MTYTQKIIKEAREKGVKVDPEVIKGLKSVEKMHQSLKSIKGYKQGDFFKAWESVHYGKATN